MEAHFIFLPGRADIRIMHGGALPGGGFEDYLVTVMPGETFMGLPYSELAAAKGGVLSIDTTADTAKILMPRVQRG